MTDRSQLSRRDFLLRLGLAGGSTLVMGAMDALELSGSIPSKKPAWTVGSHAKVLVLGAGITGMTVAFELRRLGYEVQVLEARNRVGGVNHSIRGGYSETDLEGRSQTCHFDPGHYLNAGPWRIRSGDRAVLGYCKELGVPLELFVNENDESILYFEGAEYGPFSGKPVRLREVKADLRGHTTELLAKAVDQGLLDLPLTEEDQVRLLQYLVGEGYLGREDFTYQGGNHRGGGGTPHDLPSLLRAGFANRVRSVDGSGTRPPVFQPIGGMDQLPMGFARALGSTISLGQEVVQIRQTADEVRVVVEDTRSRERRELVADYLVSCLPLTALSLVDANLSPEMREVVTTTSYSSATKIGLQMRRRFWEEDEGIYGGMTYSNLPLGQFAFPSTGYGESKGVVLGYYGGSGIGGLSPLSNEERLEHVLRNAERAHPQLREEFENGYCVLWEKLRYSHGAIASGSSGERLARLQTPDGRIYIGCAAASNSPGWMEGAVSGAWTAVEALHRRVSA